MSIDPARLKDYALFRAFWQFPDETAHAGLSHGGLDEIDDTGVRQLIDFAKKHDGAKAIGSSDLPNRGVFDAEKVKTLLDTTRSADTEQVITHDERDVMKAILEHEHYGRFFEQGTREQLMDAFGIDRANFHPPALTNHPKDAGEVDLGPRVSRHSASMLQRMNAEQLPDAFSREYVRNRRLFENATKTPEENSRAVLALLRDYTTALWARGEGAKTEQIGKNLLAMFNQTKFGNVLGGQNYNGAPWSVAQGMVLNTNANAFEKTFPKAYPGADTTRLAMNDNMADPMVFADAYRKALGQDPSAERYERQPVLNWLIGEEKGHTKHGSLSEARPFSTTGINWGIALFPGDSEIRDLKPLSGFEFPIDVLGRFKAFVRYSATAGDKLVVRDKDGKALRVEKVIQKDDDGKAVSWSAKFFTKNADGDDVEVAPADVLGVITDRTGNVKGDGKSGASMDMWWWGFCDRNTAQRLYKSKFDIPQLATTDNAAIKIRAGGEIIEVPVGDAQKLIDAHIPDLITNTSFTGFRWNGEPAQVQLANGRWIRAKLNKDILKDNPTVVRLQEDYVAIMDDPERPLVGEIQVEVGPGNIKTIDARKIETITLDPDTGDVTVVSSGWNGSATGKLLTEVPWNGAEEVDGKKVLKQTEDFLIRGGLLMETAQGEKMYQISEIQSIVAETQVDMRISQYMSWISEQGGVFATDASLGEVVSNGVRWTHKFDMDERTDETRPEWAGNADDELHGLEGPLKRQEGDKIVWARGLYANKNGTEPTSSAFKGWMQLDSNGQILNEGFISGQPDFGWGANGKLNWSARSSFNPYMPMDMLVGLMVNGVPADQLDDLAKRLNLPANYRSYLVDQGS